MGHHQRRAIPNGTMDRLAEDASASPTTPPQIAPTGPPGPPTGPDHYLALLPWDIARWKNSRAYRCMPSRAQGPYLNLCFAAWEHQPHCLLPDDDRQLWKLANCESLEVWQGIKADVFGLSDAWSWTPSGWLNEVVLETFLESARRFQAAVRSGRIAGRASGRARRAKSQASRIKEDGTTVQRPFNDRSTTVERARTVPLNENEPVVVVVDVDVVKKETEPPPPARARATPPPSDEPAVDRLRQAIRDRLPVTAQATGRTPAVLMPMASRTPTGATLTLEGLDDCHSVRWLQATLDRLVGMETAARNPGGQERPRRAADVTVDAVETILAREAGKGTREDT